MLKESKQFFRIDEGNGPVIAASIHSGHAVRDEVRDQLALDENNRLREEDPFTDTWTSIGDTRITGKSCLYFSGRCLGTEGLERTY
jgi:N-formylglutamate amidohydrolase